jgi:hypothetical protein
MAMPGGILRRGDLKEGKIENSRVVKVNERAFPNQQKL